MTLTGCGVGAAAATDTTATAAGDNANGAGDRRAAGSGAACNDLAGSGAGSVVAGALEGSGVCSAASALASRLRAGLGARAATGLAAGCGGSSSARWQGTGASCAAASRDTSAAGSGVCRAGSSAGLRNAVVRASCRFCCAAAAVATGIGAAAGGAAAGGAAAGDAAAGGASSSGGSAAEGDTGLGRWVAGCAGASRWPFTMAAKVGGSTGWSSGAAPVGGGGVGGTGRCCAAVAAGDGAGPSSSEADKSSSSGDSGPSALLITCSRCANRLPHTRAPGVSAPAATARCDAAAAVAADGRAGMRAAANAKESTEEFTSALGRLDRLVVPLRLGEAQCSGPPSLATAGLRTGVSGVTGARLRFSSSSLPWGGRHAA